MIHFPSGLACDEVWREDHLDLLYKEPIGDWREHLRKAYDRWQRQCEGSVPHEYDQASGEWTAPKVGTVQEVSLPPVRPVRDEAMEGASSGSFFKGWWPTPIQGRVDLLAGSIHDGP